MEEWPWLAGSGERDVTDHRRRQVLPTENHEVRCQRSSDGSACLRYKLLILTHDSADELEGILEDPDILSPDIGPPPVSRFENEEPISFDPNPPLEKDMEQAGEDAEPALSVNLETRKRRRESGPKLDGRRVSIFESPPETREERASRGVRAGAKRKFSVQQDDDKPTPQVEDFKFTHRKTPNVSEDESSSKDARPPSPERPVLRNKPVNTDPILSPKKQRSSATDKPDKKPLSSSKSTRGRLTITRTSQPELPALRMPQQIPVAEINLEALPPKTPAVEDIFSPPSTEPSTTRPEAKDTPPPGDLTSSDQTGARPSRRARPQVSYKEPSLNTKMRRPGKELVDAVQSHHNPRASVEATPGSLGQSTIKREPDDPNSAWKSFPIVPTQRGDEVGEAGSPLKEKLGRREAESVPEKPKLNSSAASEAISALISATSTSRRKAPTTLDTQTGASSEPLSKVETCTSKSDKLATIKQEEKDTLAIFDFTASSPNDSTAPRSQFDLAKSIKSSRRHSSVPASSATEERKTDPRTKTDGGLPSIHSRMGSVAGVKSSSTSNLARSTSASKALAKDKKTGALPTTGSNMDLKAAAEGTATSSLRAERAASRRKSMML